MFYFDAHCDTIGIVEPAKIRNSKGQSMLDFCRLAQLPGVAILAIYPNIHEKKPWQAPATAMRMATKMHEALAMNTNLVDCYLWREDWLMEPRKKKAGIMISLEGGEALGHSIARLEDFFALGVRSIGLTWNYANDLAGGAQEEAPLTQFGCTVVKRAEQLGMAVDLAHICRQAFFQVLEMAQRPPLVSHAACYTLYAHPRNLTDQQIKAIGERNGMIGIAFYPPFLTKDGADINDIVRHIDHVVSLIGHEHVGIGSDFDGIDTLPAGVKGVQDLPKIRDALFKLGYSADQVAAIMGNNFRHYWKEILPCCGMKKESTYYKE